MNTTDVISKPVYQILADLTREPRLEVALPLALKDWIRLQIREVQARQSQFQERYGMAWPAFKQAWLDGRISDKHSWDVEQDYWQWETAVTDEQRLREMLDSLP